MSLVGTVLELARVLWTLPRVERMRLRAGPRPALRRIRRPGRRARRRDVRARARLRRAIAWVDRLVPGGPNCYRRSLLEMALDAGAAAEPLVIGLNVTRGAPSGHAWVGPGAAGSYDVMLEL